MVSADDRERATGTVAAVTLAAMLACGGCGGGGQRPPGPTTTPRTSVEDVTVDAGQVTLTGLRFVPDAIGPPSMLLVHGSRRVTLERLRAAWTKAQADRKLTTARRLLDAQLLASALFEAARADAARRAALITEARTVLEASHQLAGPDTDETTLVMAAALALGVDDGPGADPYLAELISRFGDRPGGVMARAQLAYARLRSNDDAVAATLLVGADPTPTQPELAYVIAWTRFRGGNRAGAATAITAAAQGWQAEASRVAVERDLLIMFARAEVPLADATAAIATLAPQPERRHALLYQLSTAYAFAGRPDEASAALDAAVAALPAPPVALLPSIRLLQAEYARRGGHVEAVAAAWKAAAAALAACPSCGADERKALGDGIAERAVEAHTTFATSGDARYRRAAEELYALFASLPDVDGRADRAAVAQYAADFAKTQPPTDGAQYADAIKAPLAVRRQEVLACYEQALQGAPATGGALALTLEIGQDGAVTGATTDPPGGTEGLAAVASCVEARARTWRLPTRPRPGVARVSQRFVLGAKP